MVRPQKWVGSGTWVNRLKFGATAWLPRTVTSLASQVGRCCPSKGLPPPSTNAWSVMCTRWFAPAHGDGNPLPWEGGSPDPSVAVGCSPDGVLVASASVGGKLSCGR